MKLFFARVGLFSVALFLLLFSVQSFAYYSVMDTGHILPPDTYQGTLGPEFILNGDNDGTNVSGRFDAHFGKNSNLRALIGTGEVDLYTGLFFKYVPYPDFGTQPALGLIMGAIFGKETYRGRDEDALTFQITPLVSKKYETDIGDLTPYLSLPIGFRVFNSETEYPLHLAGGAKLTPPDWDGFSLIGEGGLKINKSFSYINLAVVYEFDDIQTEK